MPSPKFPCPISTEEKMYLLLWSLLPQLLTNPFFNIKSWEVISYFHHPHEQERESLPWQSVTHYMLASKNFW